MNKISKALQTFAAKWLPFTLSGLGIFFKAGLSTIPKYGIFKF